MKLLRKVCLNLKDYIEKYGYREVIMKFYDLKRLRATVPYPLRMVLRFVGLFFILFFCYIWFKPLYVIGNAGGGTVFRAGSFAQTISLILILLVVGYGVWLFVKKELTAEKFIIIVFLLAMIIRFCYLLVTSPNTRQYDTYSGNYDGHEAYAWGLYEDFQMPQTNDYQFYHPPLNAFLQAMFMHLTNGLTRLYSSIFGASEYFMKAFNDGKPDWLNSYRFYLYGTCQILAYMYSVIIMIFGLKILKLIGLKGKNLVFWFAFFALFPRHIISSATLNNDHLAYLFTIAAAYYALKWWIKTKSLKDILICAVMIGLGISTKLSAATVCLPIGLIFLYELIISLKKSIASLPFKEILKQYSLFLLVCAPIALSFIVYAKIKFNQPIGFVFSNLNDALSTKDISIFERFVVSFDKNEYFYTMYLRPFYNSTTDINNNHNLWNYLIRSSLFGEFSYWQGENFAFLAICLMTVLPVISIAMLIIMFVVRAKRKYAKIGYSWLNIGVDQKALYFGMALMLTQVLSMIYFYLRMPYSCTMDFRYILPSIISFALIFSNFEECVALDKKYEKFNLVFKGIIVVLIVTMFLFFMCAI